MSFQNITDRRAIRKVFKRFYGAAYWASKRAIVTRGTISKWLQGQRVKPEILDVLMPELAQQLVETGGACIRDANGPSVRSKINRLRRRSRGNQ